MAGRYVFSYRPRWRNPQPYFNENVYMYPNTFPLCHTTQLQNAVTCVSNLIHFPLSLMTYCERRKKSAIYRILYYLLLPSRMDRFQIEIYYLYKKKGRTIRATTRKKNSAGGKKEKFIVAGQYCCSSQIHIYYIDHIY